MSESTIVFALAWIGTGAWVVCFIWMHRISSRQDRMLDELREQASQIAEMMTMQHDILKEVHPEVGEIREVMTGVADEIGNVRDKAEKVEKIDHVAAKVDRVEELVASAVSSPSSTRSDGASVH